ncbi:MAG: diiron oxygenase [Bdellovibrio sp.]
MAADIAKVSTILSAQSVKGFYSPYDLEFPQDIEMNNWFIPPELISIFSTPEFQQLDEITQKKLSFYETINFFSINIHGEKSLVEGLTKKLYDFEQPEVTNYLHHFVDEENKHMYYFGTFCQKYAGKVYSDRKIVFPREYAEGEEEFLFYTKIFIFEELVDYYNITTAKDIDVHPLVREINRNHHVDESRHLAFGRVMLKELFDTYSSKWSPETLQNIRNYIQIYYKTTWREYYNPDIYKDAGLKEPYELSERAYESPAAKEHRAKASHASLQYLQKSGIIEEVFEL